MVQLSLGLRLKRTDHDPSKGRNIRTSQRAFDRGRINHADTRERIRVFIAGCGFPGTTLKEISRCFAVPPHAISGRISELIRDGDIFDSGRDRVDGCRVLVSRKEWINGTAEEGHKG